MSYSENLVWMDLEMTGLDPEKERIIEIATIITDSSLAILAEGPVIYVKQEPSLLDGMDEWNTEHHTASGLVDLVKTEGITEAEAEAKTLAFIASWVDKGVSPLCGNSIGQDRRFLVKYMPKLEAHLHYRNLDVSTIKELAVRWRPDVSEGVVKEGAHRAINDVKDSISELRHYRDNFFSLN